MRLIRKRPVSTRFSIDETPTKPMSAVMAVALTAPSAGASKVRPPLLRRKPTPPERTSAPSSSIPPPFVREARTLVELEEPILALVPKDDSPEPAEESITALLDADMARESSFRVVTSPSEVAAPPAASVVGAPSEEAFVAPAETPKRKRWETRIVLLALVIACEVVLAHRSGAVRVPGADRATAWVKSVAVR